MNAGIGSYCVLVVALSFGSYSATTAAIIAESVGEFSGIQGQNNWYNGFYSAAFDSTTFQQMAVFDGTTWWGDPTWPSPFLWTRLYADGGHPNGTATSGGRDHLEKWAVRRWLSEVNGSIAVSGNISDQNPGDGNGVVGRVLLGNSEVYNVIIADGNTLGIDHSIPLVVNIGSTVDFAIDPRSSNGLRDSTRFTSQFEFVPEPLDVRAVFGCCNDVTRLLLSKA